MCNEIKNLEIEAIALRATIENLIMKLGSSKPFGIVCPKGCETCSNLEPHDYFEKGATINQQFSIMKFDPATGEMMPYPSHAGQWRKYHGEATAWLFNPWDGTRRHAGDVGSDLFGHLIKPKEEPLYALRERNLAISKFCNA